MNGWIRENLYRRYPFTDGGGEFPAVDGLLADLSLTIVSGDFSGWVYLRDVVASPMSVGLRFGITGSNRTFTFQTPRDAFLDGRPAVVSVVASDLSWVGYAVLGPDLLAFTADQSYLGPADTPVTWVEPTRVNFQEPSAIASIGAVVDDPAIFTNELLVEIDPGPDTPDDSVTPPSPVITLTQPDPPADPVCPSDCAGLASINGVEADADGNMTISGDNGITVATDRDARTITIRHLG